MQFMYWARMGRCGITYHPPVVGTVGNVGTKSRLLVHSKVEITIDSSRKWIIIAVQGNGETVFMSLGK